MKKSTLVLTLMLILLLVPLTFVGANQPAPEWHDKVDPWLREQLTERTTTEGLIFLAAQADLAGAASLTTKLDKGTFVFNTLSALAESTQEPLKAELDQMGVPYRSYWVANMIWVELNGAQLAEIAQRADVAHIHANPIVAQQLPAFANPFAPQAGSIEWNIDKINAPDLWAMGYDGTGIVVGGQDTGYEWDHPALKDKYRGWDGANADHNYSWHDSIHSGGGPCGADAPAPCDDHNHGTHTMGTMVGDDGAGNQIGVAPDAKWIGCRNMDQGNGTPTTYSECFQWFIAPTDLNDQNPNPAMAPHVINNSWSCPASEGCTDPNIMKTVVENVRAAGILVVVSAGNSGSGCSTVSTPAAIYEASFTVGSTTISDVISSFSSRGPVTVDGSDRLKPDISAPGSNVRSSIRNGAYASFSGTSMAAPHVAGLAALLMEAVPALQGDVDMLEQAMEAGTKRLISTQTCGGVPGSAIPNNTFGHGRIDAFLSFGLLVTEPAEYLPVMPTP